MPNKDDDAVTLARLHYGVESGIRTIIRYKRSSDAETSPAEPIKLLEVNEFAAASGILPSGSRSRPRCGVHFPSVIVEVTPEEYERIERRELRLPEGWNHPQPIPKPEPREPE